jgi:hypothetical protein
MGLTILKNLENYEFVNGIDDIPFFEMENKKCLKQSTSFNLSNCPDQYRPMRSIFQRPAMTSIARNIETSVLFRQSR